MKANYQSDGDLVSLYINGSEKAFELLLKRHKSKIYTTIYLIVRDQYIAEDLLQETFIKAIKKLRSGSYNEEGKFAPWIVRIAHNLAIDYFRREKRYPTIVMEDGTNIFNSIQFSENSMESIRIKDETHETLKKMIEALPDSQREVLIMRHYSDMSFQEIAETTGVSINTALGRMRYALINLRKKLEKNKIAYDQNLYPE